MEEKRERNCLQSRVMPYYEKLPGMPLYKCRIEGCDKMLCGTKKYNLVVHARTHRAKFETPEALQSGLPAIRLKFIQQCTELVTINKAPFSALNWSGIKKMNENTIKTLTEAGYGIGLNPPKCRAVKSHIKYLTSEIIAQIKTEVNGKFISLMVDTAKKFHRSILGINIQFMLGSNIAIRSIGMIHLTTSHTSRHIASVIYERLEFFGIKISQLISITTDNAPNMTAMIDRCNEAFNEDTTVNDTSDSDDEDCNDSGANQDHENRADSQAPFIFMNKGGLEAILRDVVQQMESEDSDDVMELLQLQDQPNPDKLLRELEEIFEGQTMNINSIRCAAHTVQLAVMDALDIDEFKLLIRLVRVVCKELRKDSKILELREQKIRSKMPRIDCATRWNSIHLMVSLNLISSQPEITNYFSILIHILIVHK